MAYNNGGTPVYTYEGNYINVEINEVDAGSSSQTSGITIPKLGEVVCIRSVLVSGSGSTVRPSAYYDAAATSAVAIWEQAGPAAAANIYDATVFGLDAPTGLLYLKSNVDSGSDNVIRTRITFRRG